MKEIVATGTRQVQPVDFSFLSEADRDIVRGFEAYLRATNNGWDSSKPIVLQGVMGNVTTRIVSDGIILYDGRIYDVTGCGGFTPAVVGDIKIGLKQTVVSPSPVRGATDITTVDAHKNNIGVVTLQSMPAADYVCSYTELNRLNRYANAELIDELRQGIEGAEGNIRILNETCGALLDANSELRATVNALDARVRVLEARN